MNTGPPWTSTAAAPPAQKADFKPEITIIGGGPAACFLALHLGRAGVAVQMCIRETNLLAGHVSHSLPKVTLGLTDSLARLIHGIGQEKSHFILDLGLQSRTLWSELNAFDTLGGFHIATDSQEAIEIQESLGVLQQHGGWQAEAKETRFGTAYRSPLEGMVNLSAARAALMATLTDIGVQLSFNTMVTAVDTMSDGSLILRGPQPSTTTELVVYAEGWQNGALDPFLESVLTPVREQWVAYPWDQPLANHRIQYGYQYWGTAENHLLYGGCRWGSMHFEVGETEPTCHPSIHTHLTRLATQRYPQLTRPSHAWATIMTHSCDSLPLIGALPGSGNQLCCVAFQGHSCALAPALAKRLATVILEGESPTLPHWLRPHRLKL
ncbi:MAG: NAD(P)/FAD-dependent oxidoreductase [Myxococcota bacterium]